MSLHVQVSKECMSLTVHTRVSCSLVIARHHRVQVLYFIIYELHSPHVHGTVENFDLTLLCDAEQLQRAAIHAMQVTWQLTS